RIAIGSEKENPVRLSRQDWRGDKAGWNADSLGHWEVKVERTGKYKVTIRSDKDFASCTGTIVASPLELKYTHGGLKVAEEQIEVAKTGEGRVELRLIDQDGTNKRGPMYVEIEYVGPLDKK